MDFLGISQKPHAVLVPFPAQGHVIPFMSLAKLLHAKGFFITFVNTEFNHRRLIKSKGPDSVKGLEDFKFETIPDGLPPSDKDATQVPPAICDSTRKNCLAPFKELLVNEFWHQSRCRFGYSSDSILDCFCLLFHCIFAFQRAHQKRNCPFQN